MSKLISKSVMLLLIAILSLSTTLAVFAATPGMTPVVYASVPGTTPGPQLTNGMSYPTQAGTYTVVPAPSSANLPSTITVTISLKPQGDLQGFVASISNPSSPLYHQFGTTQSIANNFGISQSTYDSIVSYFQGYGLTVSTSGDRLSLSLTGTPSQISSAFHTNVRGFYLQYQSKGFWNPLFGNQSGVNGSVTQIPFYANTESLQLPASIVPYISAITGLDGALATPSVNLPYGLYPGENASQLFSNMTTPSPSATFVSSSTAVAESNGYFGWFSACFFFGGCGKEQVYFPSTIPRATGATNLWSGANTINNQPDQGQGITIALVEVGLLDPAIIQGFSQQVFHDNSLLNRVTEIGVGIPSLQAGIADGYAWGWSIETALDLEYVAAMAPQAHIDIVGIPSAYFSAFGTVFPFIGQYLTTGDPCNIPAGNVVYGPTQGACSVTITSNSYGSGETFTAYFGSPMYLTMFDQELSSLAAQGVTNFFASGDYGGYFINLEGDTAATSPGQTPVGGGSLIVTDNGNPYPNTGVYTQFCGFSFNGFCYSPLTLQLGNTTSLQDYSYWSYGFGLGGTFQGFIGGGLGISNRISQPWWEHAIDTYEAGAMIEPVVSGPADFEMTIYFPFFGSTWLFFYGGTSFATPITAAEWALVEEQALSNFGSAKFGDINPILFSLHNSFQAGLSSVNPYYTMENKRLPSLFGSTAPANYYDSYVLSLEYSYPDEQNMPAWMFTLQNPQGNGWSFLGGLGLVLADKLDQAVIGTIPGYSYVQPSYVVEILNPDGSLSPFTTLTAGQTYKLEVLFPNGNVAQNLNIVAYSGGAYTDNGVSYIPGTSTTITTSNGIFTYTPQWASPSVDSGSGEYGYFLITSASGSGPAAPRAFAQFEVAEPAATGTLTLGVETPYGLVTNGPAQVPMFTQFDALGYYTLGSTGVVMLNGKPVAGATITQVAEQVNYSILDSTLPPSLYAPGVTIGTWLSDLRGQFNLWTDAFIAENNGPVPTQIYTLQASYHGLKSNIVTVFVEPQAGLFQENLHISGNSIVGTVTFTDMRYVSNVTIGFGTGAGQSQTTTYPAVMTDPNFGSSLPISGVYHDTISVDLTNLPSPSTGPIVVNIAATGANDESFSFCFFGFCFVFPAVSNPIVWEIAVPVDPVAQVSVNSGLSQGTEQITYQGLWAGSNAVGTVTLTGPSGSQVIASGVSGTATVNTQNLPDGVYLVSYNVVAPGDGGSTATTAFVVDNALLNQVSTLQTENSQLQTQLNTTQQQLTAAQTTISSLNATVQSLQSQNSKLQQQVSSLESQLSQLQSSASTYTTQINQLNSEITQLNSQITTLQKLNESNSATIASLQQQVSNDAAQVSSLQSQLSAAQNKIAQLTSQLQSLTQQLSNAQAKNGSLVDLAVALGVAVVAAIGAGVAVIVRARRVAAPTSTTTSPPISR
jgi:subtilase family serine protease